MVLLVAVLDLRHSGLRRGFRVKWFREIGCRGLGSSTFFSRSLQGPLAHSLPTAQPMNSCWAISQLGWPLKNFSKTMAPRLLSTPSEGNTTYVQGPSYPRYRSFGLRTTFTVLATLFGRTLGEGRSTDMAVSENGGRSWCPIYLPPQPVHAYVAPLCFACMSWARLGHVLAEKRLVAQGACRKESGFVTNPMPQQEAQRVRAR